MKWRIEIFHHHHTEPGGADPRLDQLLAHTTALLRQGAVIMAKVDELNAELVEINQKTDDMAVTAGEIASDIDDLQARLAGGLSPAEAETVRGELATLKGKLGTMQEALAATASKHTP